MKAASWQGLASLFAGEGRRGWFGVQGSPPKGNDKPARAPAQQGFTGPQWASQGPTELPWKQGQGGDYWK